MSKIEADVRVGHVSKGASYNECWHCQDRQLGCHSHCKAYLAFFREREERREERKRERKEKDDFAGVFARRVRSNDRYKKKGR